MPTLAEQWASQGRAKGLQEGLEKGLEQDLEKGRQEGAYIGTIQTCRSILGEPGDSADLPGKSLDELQSLAAMQPTQPSATPTPLATLA